ncbi:aminotransferase class V-fold PLP-dependent enzyme [Streptomyces sp. NPDC047097]|uniref:pyridoxal phosphate-dependent decarboxylase family protein n=1 Tax=Streptomyces sp. NPDC047097 TaxID=3155260 RepID=UPI0033C08A6C
MDDDLGYAWPQMEKLAQRGLTMLGEYLDTETPRAALPLTADLRQRVTRPPSAAPGDGDDLLELFFEAARASQNLSSPRFMGYIPTGGLTSTALAQLLATAVNPYTALSHFSPALVAMEDGIMRWLCDLFGMPASAVGTMTTGTSLALLTAVVAARDARLDDDPRDGTAYVTAHTHHTVEKALRIAGLTADQLRVVACTPEGRMDPGAAAELVAADRAAGLRPFLIVATAGTTATGRVDHLADIGELAAAERLWFHVDAAYGGGFLLTERGRLRLAGIERADTITLDPHKSFFLAAGTGVLLTRQPRFLRTAFAQPGACLTDLAAASADTLPDYTDLGPELTREFRGLRLWLPLHLHGTAAFTGALDRMLDLAEEAHRRLSAVPELDVDAPPDLSVVAFRLRGRSNDDNRAFLRRVNQSEELFLSGADVDGVYTLRMAFLSQRLDRRHMESGVAVVLRALREATGTAAPGAA